MSFAVGCGRRRNYAPRGAIGDPVAATQICATHVRLFRHGSPAGGPRHIKKSGWAIYEVVDLDTWIEEGKRRISTMAVDD